MIPRHVIRANEQTRIPRRFIYLDTEARQKVETQKVQTWRLGVTAFTRSDNPTKEWSEPNYVTHDDPTGLWQYVDGRTVRRARTVLVAHNLAYDLRIARAFHIVPKFGWRLDRLGLHDRSLTVTWRRDDRSLVMVDSMSWLPTSLESIGGLPSIPKLDLPEWDESDEAWEARCKRDVEILFASYHSLVEFVEREDLGNWQRTGAGMAWANWRHCHYTHKVQIHDSEEAQRAETESTYTGRCEAWRHGKLTGGPFTEWDLPMAYARVALDIEVPTRLGYHVTCPPLHYAIPVRRGRRVLCKATVSTKGPILPVKRSTGFLWPVGEFSGWYWDSELELAMREGAAVEIDEAWVYPSDRALADWARWVIDVAEGTDDRYTPVERMAVKHWSRALIGRFASKYKVWEPFEHWHADTVESAGWIDLDAQQMGTRLTLGRESWIAMEEQYGADAFPAVQAAVMSECRSRLWRIMRTAGLSEVVYCDTDSVITTSRGSRRLSAIGANAGLWGLRPKRRWRELTILGPRQLSLDGAPRFSGIPHAAKAGSDGRLRGERWESLSNAFALGRADQVVITPTTWTVTGKDARRTHHSDGSTSPKVLRLGDGAVRSSRVA